MAKIVVISGQTGSGKTTRAKELGVELGRRVVCTDDCLKLGRDKRGQAVRDMLDSEEDLVVEGNMAMRALDRMLKEPESKTAGIEIERLEFMTKPFERITDRQASIGLMNDVVLKRIEGKLRARGTKIVKK